MTIKRLIAWGCGGILGFLVLMGGLLWGYYQLSMTTYWMVSDTTGLAIPVDYESVDSSYTSFGFDYTVERTVRFDPSDFEDLTRRVEKTPFFNTDPEDIPLDHLKKAGVVGSWQKTSYGYVFSALPTDGPPASEYVFDEAWGVSCRIYPESRTLQYRFIKI